MDLSTEQQTETAASAENPDVEKEGEGMPENPSNPESSSKHPKKGGYESFLEELEAQEGPEKKISFILDFMESSISQGGSPSFKNFWDARKLCLSLFKEENLSYAVRAHLWSKYVELSKEAHRLKEVLDEQSAFAVEQIKLAIEALETDLEKMDDPLSHAPEIKFEHRAKFLKENEGAYIDLQRELSLLNAFAARINELRKELISTDMRIRFKNSFFQKLSSAGDLVFPRRKELIKKVSQQFISDVDQFIEQNFTQSQFAQPVYVLRDEIKALQSMAKVLTLNTQAFNQTRMRLSECWDKIKKIEKDRKKERAKIQASFKENVALVEPKIKELEEKYAAQELDDHQVETSIREIQDFMRTVKLGRDDVKELKNRLNKIRAEQAEKAAALQKERLEKERKIEEERKAAFDQVFVQLEALVKEVESKSLEETLSEKERLRQEFDQINLTRSERQDVEREFKIFGDKLSKIKIDNLSSDDREAYEQLQSLLKECRQRRKEIRDQVEEYRKASGSSGLDFEQALKQSELMEQEKERLSAIDSEIEEIEKRINELGDKL